MQKNALVESSRVVIIDDLLATGGTLIVSLTKSLLFEDYSSHCQ